MSLDNALHCAYTVQQDGCARLIQIYGNTPCPTLPATLGAVPLTAIGDYCFCETARASALPKPEDWRWVELAHDGTQIALETAPDTNTLHRICGRFLETLSLPNSVTTVGSYAFYNCRTLHTLTFGGALNNWGSDVFLNTPQFKRLYLRAHPSDCTGLFRMLQGISHELSVYFIAQTANNSNNNVDPFAQTQEMPENKQHITRGALTANQPIAALLFPEFWEESRESPAHIFLNSYSGQGYHYRQCFQSDSLDFQEYDSVFLQVKGESAIDSIATLSFLRLVYPYQLAPENAENYRVYVKQNALFLLKRLLKEEDENALSAFLTLNILTAETFLEALTFAQNANNAPFTAQLLQQQNAMLAQNKPKQKTFSFDDF